MVVPASPARERLLEGFLMRLAVARDADAFALRGGMLVRALVPKAGRPIRDADLVCSLPYRIGDLRERLREILAHRDIGDGVVFDAERFRIDTMRPEGRPPALELFATGEVDGVAAEMTIDISFQRDVWPSAKRRMVRGARGGARVWTCAHELLLGTKLRVIAELGPSEWRPKDLADIWLVMRRFPPGRSLGVVGEAIERSFAGPYDVSETISAAWWREPHTASRWARYAARYPAVPSDLDAVIADVRQQLAPLLARQP